MKQGQKHYDTTEVLEIIDRYSQMKRALGFEVESPYTNDMVVANYDSLGMPRGGGISDPTPKQAFRNTCILPDRLAKEYVKKIDFIDKYSMRLTKEREITVLHWKLSGMKTKHIAELEGVTDRQIRNILRKIAEIISDISAISDISNVS